MMTVTPPRATQRVQTPRRNTPRQSEPSIMMIGGTLWRGAPPKEEKYRLLWHANWYLEPKLHWSNTMRHSTRPGYNPTPLRSTWLSLVRDDGTQPQTAELTKDDFAKFRKIVANLANVMPLTLDRMNEDFCRAVKFASSRDKFCFGPVEHKDHAEGGRDGQALGNHLVCLVHWKDFSFNEDDPVAPAVMKWLADIPSPHDPEDTPPPIDSDEPAGLIDFFTLFSRQPPTEKSDYTLYMLRNNLRTISHLSNPEIKFLYDLAIAPAIEHGIREALLLTCLRVHDATDGGFPAHLTDTLVGLYDEGADIHQALQKLSSVQTPDPQPPIIPPSTPSPSSSAEPSTPRPLRSSQTVAAGRLRSRFRGPALAVSSDGESSRAVRAKEKAKGKGGEEFDVEREMIRLWLEAMAHFARRFGCSIWIVSQEGPYGAGDLVQ